VGKKRGALSGKRENRYSSSRKRESSLSDPEKRREKREGPLSLLIFERKGTERDFDAKSN